MTSPFRRLAKNVIDSLTKRFQTGFRTREQGASRWTYTRESAQDLAGSVLLYMAERPDLIGGFLGATGLRPEDLRTVSTSPETALHVLDYLLEDDRRVLDAAADLGIPPQDMMRARTALAGPGSFGWDI